DLVGLGKYTAERPAQVARDAVGLHVRAVGQRIARVELLSREANDRIRRWITGIGNEGHPVQRICLVGSRWRICATHPGRRRVWRWGQDHSVGVDEIRRHRWM